MKWPKRYEGPFPEDIPVPEKCTGCPRLNDMLSGTADYIAKHQDLQKNVLGALVWNSTNRIHAVSVRMAEIHVLNITTYCTGVDETAGRLVCNSVFADQLAIAEMEIDLRNPNE